MAFSPYATVTEVKNWVTIEDTVDDTAIASIVASASRWIDEYCQRHFWQDGATGTEVARTFAPDAWWCLNLGAFNDLVSVTAVAGDPGGDGTFEDVWPGADYQLAPTNRPTGRPFTRIEAVGGHVFPVRCYPTGRTNLLQVTGVWGWPAVPEDVTQACLIQSARLLGRRRSPEGVTGGLGDFGPIRVSSRVDPDVEQLLGPYQRTAVLVE